MSSPDRVDGASRLDAFFSGRFRLHQPEKGGFRAGLDALLLAACVPVDASGACADIGAGTGAVGFGAALRAPGLAVSLVEKDPAAVELLQRSVAEAGNAPLAARLTVAQADILAGRSAREAAGLADNGFRWVLTNPPFFPGDHRRSPDASRDAALFTQGPDFLRRWLRACAALLELRGRLCLIARPADLPAIADALERRLGGLAVLPVHTRPGAARRILVGARAGSREGLSILPGLILHGEAAQPALQAVSDGTRAIDLFPR